jgi:two-component system, LytTR family, sensor kinase
VKSLSSTFLPALLGLLVYASIRLVSDIPMGYRFWERPLLVNTLEIAGTFAISYALYFILRRMIQRFNAKAIESLSPGIVAKELRQIFLVVFIFLNCTATVLAAVTDDGLSVADAVIINIIPMVFILMYYLFARASYFWQSLAQKQVQLEQLHREQLQTELKFLKAQYHPHFLFNALNTVYFQMDEDVEAAKKTIEKFSGLLRYQLYDQSQMVQVSKEIQYLDDFISLQRLRMSDSIQWKIEIGSNWGDKCMHPLMLLPLVENACKYVSRPGSIFISIQPDHENLVCKISNSTGTKPTTAKGSGGLGLENLKRRLDLLYPGKYRLELQAAEGNFSAWLQIPLFLPQALENLNKNV